jgi:hypothetical protein
VNAGTNGVGINELLGLLEQWGPCISLAGTSTELPQTVEECIDRYGYDEERLAACICIVEPCTEGCPPEGCE